MAKRKRDTKSKINKERILDDINTAKPGEFCYFIEHSKKIGWGEIQKISSENEELVFQIMEEKESRYVTVLAKYCSFSEKLIKEKKGGK